MLRESISLISLLIAVVLGGYAAYTAVSTIFGLDDSISRRGVTLEADWLTTGVLAAVAIVFFVISRFTQTKIDIDE